MLRKNTVVRQAALSLAVLLAGSRFATAAISDTYVGDNNGLWSAADNWSAGVPNNNGLSTYGVIINAQPVTQPGWNALTVRLDTPVTIDTLAMGTGDILRVLKGSTLTLAAGALANSGLLVLDGGTAAQLVLRTDTFLSGGGAINMIGPGNAIDSLGAARLISDNAIFGEGNIGSSAGSMKVVNLGGIMATTGRLTVNASRLSTVTDSFINMGLMGADGGTLVLNGVNYNNVGGVIEARANSVVTVNPEVVLSGGILRTMGGTVILGSIGMGNVTLADTAMSGYLRVGGASTVTLLGSLSNAGTLSALGGGLRFGVSPGTSSPVFVTNTGVLQAGFNAQTYGSLGVFTNTTLSGGGTLVLDNANFVQGGTGYYRLTTDNVIVGRGTLGMTSGNGIFLTNSGTITATTGILNMVSSAYYNPSNPVNNYNTGVLRADGGTLVIGSTSVFSSVFSNAGGVIEALGNSVVSITSNITGGTIRSVGGGTVTIGGGISNVTFGGNILTGSVGTGYQTTLSGTVNNGGTLVLNGITNLGAYAGGSTSVSLSLNNTGLIQVGQTTNYATPTLYISADTTLSGGGSVRLSGNNFNFQSSGYGMRLTTENVITGKGVMGTNSGVGNGYGVYFTNKGTITATSVTGGYGPNILTLYTGYYNYSNPQSSYNSGVLRADGGTLLLNGYNGGGLINTGGLIEAAANSVVNIGTLTISGGTVRSVGGGTVTVSGGLSGMPSALALSGLVMAGTPSGASTTLLGTLTNAGTLVLNGTIGLGSYSGSNVASPTLTLNNTGLIQVGQSTNSYVPNLIISADTTLSGGGSVTLYGNNFNYQGGNTALRLTTDNVISGKGVLGMNGGPGVFITNKGTITATYVSGSGLNGLTLYTGYYNPSISQYSYNSGVLRADGGTLNILGYNNGGLINTGGLIEAAANSVVNIGTMTVSGGTVRSVGGGTVTVYGGLSGTQSALALSGLVITNTPYSYPTTLSGTLTNAGTLVLNGPNTFGYYSGSNVAPQALTITNTGLIQVGQSTNSPTPQLNISADTTLSGGGSVTLYGNNFGYNYQGGNYGMRLTTDNVITGKGMLGTNIAVGNGNGVYFNNKGTITAANVGGYGPNSLTMFTGYYNPSNPQYSFNSGVLRADGGTFVLAGYNNLSGLINTGGLIEAAANSVVMGTLTIVGGTVRSVGGGTVTISGGLSGTQSALALSGLVMTNTPYGGPSTTLSGTLTNAGTLVLNGQNTFGISSGTNVAPPALTITNTGLIQVGQSTNSPVPQLNICADTTLSGGGAVSLYGNNFNYQGGSYAVRLTTDNVISGKGGLGANTGPGVYFTNKGTITATAVTGGYGSNSLTLYTGYYNSSNPQSSYNSGVLRANGGSLVLMGATNLVNTGGLIEAAANNLVNLNGGSITGGVVRAVGGGTVTIANATLVNTTLSGNIWSQNGQATFAGMLTNAGTLSFVGSNYPLYFGVTAGFTVMSNAGLMQFGNVPTYFNCDTLWTDGGSVTLSGSAFNPVGTVRLTTDNILSGYGALGAGTFRLTNAGTITATSGSLGLTTDTNAGVVNACLNTGVLRADGGSLVLSGGLVSNTNGVVEALHGSTVSLRTQVNGGTLRVASGGILRLESNNVIGPDATISFEGGILQYSPANAMDYSARFSTAANQAFVIDTNGMTVALGTALRNAGGSFTKLGAGTVIMNTANSYTGATTILGGYLQFGVNQAIPDGSRIIVNGSSGTAILNLNGFSEYTCGSVTLAGNGAIVGGVLNTVGGIELQSGTVSAVLSGSLNKTTAGQVNLTATDAHYSSITLADGILTLGHIGALGTQGTLIFTGGILQASGANSLNYSARFSTADNQMFKLDTNGWVVGLYTSLMNQGATFTKYGNGTLQVNVTQGYTGMTTVLAGSLQLHVDDAIAGGGGITVNGPTAKLDLNNYVESSAGSVTLINGSIVGGAHGGTLSVTSIELQSGTVSATLAGGGAVNKTTSGTVVLSGTNSHYNGTNLYGGVLSLGCVDALGTTGPINFSGGVLQFTAANTQDYSARFSTADHQAFNLDTNGQVVALGTSLMNIGGSLTKLGTGTLTLNATQGYTGMTTVLAGTLQLGVDDAIAGGGGITVNGPTSVLDLNNHVETNGGIVTLDGGGLIVGGTLSTAGYELKSGVVSATLAGGAVNKTTSGTVVLTGTNSCLGGTNLSGGVLVLGSTSAMGTQGTMTFSGGILQFSAVNTQDYSARFSTADNQAFNLDTNGQVVALGASLASVGGTLTKLGEGTLTLNATNGYTGMTTVLAGTLKFGVDEAIAGGGGITIDGPTSVLDLNHHVVSNAGVVTLDGVGTISGGTLSTSASFELKSGFVSAVLAGSGIVNKTTGGTVVLTGNNSYYGGTNLADGVLALGSTSAMGTQGTMTFAGGTLQFSMSNAQDYSARFSTADNQAFNLDTNGQTVTLASSLTSVGGNLTKNGPGTLILSAANTYANTTINVGEIGVVGNGSLGSGTVNNAGVLVLNTLTAMTFNGVISGIGTLTQLSGTVNFAGNNTYAGPTNIFGGTLQIGAGGSSGNFGTGTVLNNGVLTFNRSDAFTVNNALSGSGVVNMNGTGTLNLTGTNTYAGGTNLNNGVVSVGSANALGSSGSITFNGGTLQYTAANSQDYSARFSTDAGQAIVLDLNGQSVTINTPLVSAGGSFTVLGTGYLTLKAANNYDGLTTITASTLRVDNGGDTASLGSGPVLNNGALVFLHSGVLTVSGDISGSGSLTQMGAGTVILTGSNTYNNITNVVTSTLQIGNGGTTGSVGAGAVLNTANLAFNRSDVVTFGNSISGSGSLTQAGAGTLILTGTHSYSGSTVIATGTLQIGDGGTSGSMGTGAVLNSGVLAFNRSDTITINNTISGSGMVNMLGTGTLNLTGANSFFGGVNLTNGVVSLGSINAPGTQGTMTFAGGTLQFTSPNTQDYSARFSTAPGQVFNLDTNGQSVTLNNSLLSAGGSLVKLGTGTLKLNASSGYDGVTTIVAGTLWVGNNSTTGSLGSGAVINSGNLVFSRTDATFYVTNDISGSGTVTLNGPAIINTMIYTGNLSAAVTNIGASSRLQVGNGGNLGSISSASIINYNLLSFNCSEILLVSSAISGSGDLKQNGPGTVILTGDNSYYYTFINAGILQIGNGGASGSLGTNTVTINSVLSFNRSNVITVNNVISGSGVLNMDGSGTLILGGANTYYGGTNLNHGVLTLGNGSAVGTQGTMTFAGGILQFAGTTQDFSARFSTADNQAFKLDTNGSTITLNTPLTSVDGALTKLGLGSLWLNASNNYNGLTTIAAGTLQVGTGGTTGSLGSGAVLNHATLAFNRSDLLTVPNAISGSGALAQNGWGTVILAGVNDYGSTAINAGLLQIGNGGITGNLGTGAVLNNSSLVFKRSNILTVSNDISGSGTLTQAGDGTVTLSGDNSYTGGTNLSNGVVSLGSAGALGTQGIVAFTGGTLQFTAANTQDYSARFSDAAKQVFNIDTNGQDVTLATPLISTGGSLNKYGAGTLIINASPVTPINLVFNGSFENGNTGWFGTSTAVDSVRTGNTHGGAYCMTLGSVGTLATLMQSLTINNGDTYQVSFWLSSDGGTPNQLKAYFTGGLDFPAVTLSNIPTQGYTQYTFSTLVGANYATLKFESQNNPGYLRLDDISIINLSRLAGYNGVTTISAGTLQIGNGGNTGSLGSGPVANNAELSFNRNDAIVVTNPISGPGTLTQSGSGTTTLSNYAGTGPLNLTAGRLAFAPTTVANNKTVVTPSLTISGANNAWTSTLDLGNSALIVQASATGDGNAAQTQARTIANQIAAGLDLANPEGLLFTGTGITSSTAGNYFNTTGNPLYAVGWLQNNTLGLTVGDGTSNTTAADGAEPLYPDYGPFAGDNPTAGLNDILVKYTYWGDADLNGVVDDTDVALLVNGYQLGLSGWVNGDFDYNGIVDDTDVALLINAYQFQSGPLTSGFTTLPRDGSVSTPTTPIPEPTSLMLLGLGSLVMLRKPRRR